MNIKKFSVELLMIKYVDEIKIVFQCLFNIYKKKREQKLYVLIFFFDLHRSDVLNRWLFPEPYVQNARH